MFVLFQVIITQVHLLDFFWGLQILTTFDSILGQQQFMFQPLFHGIFFTDPFSPYKLIKNKRNKKPSLKKGHSSLVISSVVTGYFCLFFPISMSECRLASSVWQLLRNSFLQFDYDVSHVLFFVFFHLRIRLDSQLSDITTSMKFRRIGAIIFLSNFWLAPRGL